MITDFRSAVLSSEGLCGMLSKKKIFDEKEIESLTNAYRNLDIIPTDSNLRNIGKIKEHRDVILKTAFELSKLCLSEYADYPKLLSLLNPLYNMYAERKELVGIPALLSREELKPTSEAFKNGGTYKFVKAQLNSKTLDQILLQGKSKYSKLQQSLEEGDSLTDIYLQNKEIFSAEENQIVIAIASINCSMHLAYLAITQCLLSNIIKLTERNITNIRIKNSWKPLCDEYEITTVPTSQIQYPINGGITSWNVLARIKYGDIDGYAMIRSCTSYWGRDSGLESSYSLYNINEDMSIFNLQV